MHERRARRSNDPLVALHYKLTKTRADRGLDAMVVADADGLVIAGSGAWPLCEEVAAYAPLISELPGARALPPRLDGRLHVARGDGLWLCAVGDDLFANDEQGEARAALQSLVEDTHDAVVRILAA